MHPFALHSRHLQCAVASLLLSSVALPASSLDVWLDFTTDFHDGNDGAPNGVADWIDELNEATQSVNLSNNPEATGNIFTTAQRELIQNNIQGELNRIYSGTTINFVTEQPAGRHDVIYFGLDNDNRNVGNNFLGLARGDFANNSTNTYSAFSLLFPSGNPTTVPRVAPANFGAIFEPTEDSLDRVITEISTTLGGTAAHEFGHSLGLFHHFAYSAEGITPENFTNTGRLQNQHIIADGSAGFNEAEFEDSTRTLSPFSRVALDVAGGQTSVQLFGRETTPVVANHISSDDSELASGDAGNTLATAQPLTLETGTLSGAEISFIEADLDGSSDDVDLFRFDIPVEGNFSAHLFSERNFFGLRFDATLALLDADGNQIAFSDDPDWGGNSIRFDGSESLNSNDSSFENDPALFNILLAAGTYYLEVAAADINISDVANVGDQYSLVTSVLLIPEPTAAAVLALGSLALIRRRRSA